MWTIDIEIKELQMNDPTYDKLKALNGEWPTDFDDSLALAEEFLLGWDYTKKQPKTLADLRAATTIAEHQRIVWLTTAQGSRYKCMEGLRNL